MRVLYLTQRKLRDQKENIKRFTPSHWNNLFLYIETNLLIDIFGYDGFENILLNYIQVYKPHVLWVFPPYDFLSVECINKIKIEKTIILAYAYDDDIIFTPEFLNKKNINDLIFKYYSRYDVFCTTSKNLYNKALESGLNDIYYIRQAASAELFKKYDIPYKYDVTLAGSPYEKRVEEVRAIKKAGIDIKLFGNGWTDIEGLKDSYVDTRPISEISRVFSSSKINLTTSYSYLGKIPHIKERTAFISLSGGFQLSTYVPEISDYFVENEEIVCYRNTEELIDKINYYLKHEDEREKIAHNGYKRAIVEHTWDKRWEEMYNIILENHEDRISDLPLSNDYIDRSKIESLFNVTINIAQFLDKKGFNEWAESYYRESLIYNWNSYTANLGVGKFARLKSNIHDSEYYLKRALQCSPDVLCHKFEPSSLFNGLRLTRWGIDVLYELASLYAAMERNDDIVALFKENFDKYINNLETPYLTCLFIAMLKLYNLRKYDYFYKLLELYLYAIIQDLELKLICKDLEKSNIDDLLVIIEMIFNKDKNKKYSESLKTIITGLKGIKEHKFLEFKSG